MKRIGLFAIIIAFVVGSSCTDEEAARSVLEDEGYTNIELNGYAYGRCSKNDSTCTEFKATGPSGREVKGAVGCGRTGCGKACTVRIFAKRGD